MDQNALAGVTQCTEKAGIAAGSTTTYLTANAVNGCIMGEFVTELAAQSNTATPTTDYNGDAFTVVPKNFGCIFVYSLIAAGTIKFHQSDVVALDAAGDFVVAPNFPTIDLDTYMPFGCVVVRNGSTGSDWTFGASNWNATGIVDTYYDYNTLPRRPPYT